MAAAQIGTTGKETNDRYNELVRVHELWSAVRPEAHVSSLQEQVLWCAGQGCPSEDSLTEHVEEREEDERALEPEGSRTITGELAEDPTPRLVGPSIGTYSLPPGGPAGDAGISGDDEFIAGYRAYGGRAEWEQHFLRVVLPCEGGDWGTSDYGNGYVSRAQFTPDSWRSSEARAGRKLDSSLPYDIGAAVAVWSNAIDNPGGRGGWPVCWWR